MTENINDRLGHDTKYDVDTSKIAKLGIKINNKSFNKNLLKTINWYLKIFMKSKNLCNFCNSNLKQEVIDLGKTPLANSYSEKPLKLNKYKLQVLFKMLFSATQYKTKG